MLKIPKKAFSEEADDQSQVAPDVGDEVNLDGMICVVKAEEGENLLLEPKAYNGYPVEYAREKKPNRPAEDSLRKAAREEAEEGSY